MSDKRDTVLIRGADGQVMRSALGLAIASGRPLRLTDIRSDQRKPGLLRQHLSYLRAAAAIADAGIEGDALGSQEVLFRPGVAGAGEYSFKMGTAGNCLLLLQTVLPPLLLADGPSVIALEGVTHSPDAPPFELIERAFLPALDRMGAEIRARLERPGFMPAGGGRVVVQLTPRPARPFEAARRSAIRRCSIEALFANLPADIARRELDSIGARLNVGESDLSMREVRSDGPGNALIVTMEHDQGAEVVAEVGTHGRSAETVARMAAREAEVFMAGDAAIGRHLAQQLMLPMALLGGGRFTTVRPSRQSIVTADVIRKFAPDAVTIKRLEEDGHLHEVQIDPIIAPA